MSIPLTPSPDCCVVPVGALGAHSIDLVDEHDAGRMLPGLGRAQACESVLYSLRLITRPLETGPGCAEHPLQQTSPRIPIPMPRQPRPCHEQCRDRAMAGGPHRPAGRGRQPRQQWPGRAASCQCPASRTSSRLEILAARSCLAVLTQATSNACSQELRSILGLPVHWDPPPVHMRSPLTLETSWTSLTRRCDARFMTEQEPTKTKERTLARDFCPRPSQKASIPYWCVAHSAHTCRIVPCLSIRTHAGNSRFADAQRCLSHES